MIIIKKSPAFFNVAIITILIIITSILNCPTTAAASATNQSLPTQTAASWQNFAGTWEGEDEYALMRLTLNVDIDKKNIYGSHKAISHDGKMVDMVSEDTMSINGFFVNSTLAEVSYVGGYNPADRGTGTAHITLIDANTIKWQTTYREGISYIPVEIQLKKISPTADEAQHILYKNAWSVFDTKSKRQFTLKSPIKNVTDALGVPKSKTLFLGGGTHSGEIYNYDGVEILAEKSAGGDIVAYIYISSAQFITPGDLKVGDSLEKLIGLYGAIEKGKKTKDGTVEWYTYIVNSKNDFKSSFAVADGIIKSIRFSTPLGWTNERNKSWNIFIKNSDSTL